MKNFFRKSGPPAIRVKFFDVESGQQFAESDIPAPQLPESFEASTTLHIGDQDWSVEEARPMTAWEFLQSGELILILRKVKIETIDPKKILYSLPSINDHLPTIREGSSKLGHDVLEIHEDDWRQREWVAARYIDDASAELDEIARIHEHERKGPAFKTLHVRSRIVQPLDDAEVSTDHVRDMAGPRAVWLDGFGFPGVAGIVSDSFAVRMLSSIEILGIATDGRVRVACLANTRVNNLGAEDVRSLVRFAAERELLLVDWCRMAVIQPSPEEYASYFCTEG
jgi:hypothetical protein